MSLLQKAKAQTPQNTITPEHIELAQAFVRGEIGITAINNVLGNHPKSPQGYITVCRALREVHKQNQPPTQEEIDEVERLCIMYKKYLKHTEMTQEEIDEELAILHR